MAGVGKIREKKEENKHGKLLHLVVTQYSQRIDGRTGKRVVVKKKKRKKTSEYRLTPPSLLDRGLRVPRRAERKGRETKEGGTRSNPLRQGGLTTLIDEGNGLEKMKAPKEKPYIGVGGPEEVAMTHEKRLRGRLERTGPMLSLCTQEHSLLFLALGDSLGGNQLPGGAKKKGKTGDDSEWSQRRGRRN